MEVKGIGEKNVGGRVDVDMGAIGTATGRGVETVFGGMESTDVAVGVRTKSDELTETGGCGKGGSGGGFVRDCGCRFVSSKGVCNWG